MLVVGLGNPGPQYECTRHNVGFMAIDCLADRSRAPSFRQRNQGEFSQALFGDESRMILARPLTYMNRSGDFVQPLASYFRIAPPQIVVLHDELDLELGTVRIKSGGGAGGHNGLKSIISRLATPDFVRIRIGIGRPQHGNVTSYVLSAFTADEESVLEKAVETAADAVTAVMKEDASAAMNRFNRRNP